MRNLSKSDLSDLNEEINTALKSVFNRYGLHYGGFKGVFKEKFYFINALGSENDIHEMYAELYNKHCKAVGLAEEWLKAMVHNPATDREMCVIGLDPLCGEACVRLEDKEGNRYNITPSELHRLMSK